MYGTIARIRAKPGHFEELVRWAEDWNLERKPKIAGAISSYLFTPDGSPYGRPTQFLIAVFEDQKTYRQNSDDPAQDAWYRRMREHLEDDPDWSDGTFQSF
jgi:quinol monooxygenase YgiN